MCDPFMKCFAKQVSLVVALCKDGESIPNFANWYLCTFDHGQLQLEQLQKRWTVLN